MLGTKADLSVAVIGGGAAGIFAAIACAEANPAARVTVLERSSHILAKVKISGGGRCNVTHACFDSVRLMSFYPRGAEALRGPFSRFQPRDTMQWFADRGVRLKVEADGRVFPESDNSQTIIDAFMQAAVNAHVVIQRQAQIHSLNPLADEDGWAVTFTSGDTLKAQRLIMATGSSPQGWAWAQSLGHTIEPPVPSLFTFTVKDPRLDGLAGVAVPQVRLAIPGTGYEQAGALLITHWGLSGPAVLKLSAWAARHLHEKQYAEALSVNWLGELKVEAALSALQRYRAEHMNRAAMAGGPFALPKRLWVRLLAAVTIAEAQHWSGISNAKILALAQELTQGRYRMNGKSTFKEEFVTCGGVRLDEVDFRTMMSKRQRSLYFAGEMLNIDAVTGGFNFQAAWTTGWLAGRSAAQATA